MKRVIDRWLLFVLLTAWSFFPGCAVFTAEAAPSVLAVEGLRCEYLSEPLGIAAPAPRLSWILISEQRGQGQAAFRVRAASARELLEAGDPDLWDSGRVDSDRSIHVEYAGKPLVSGAPCFWQVKAWGTRGGESPWSRPAFFEMGLLAPSDWKAGWITDGKPLPEKDEDFYHDDPAPLLRKAFFLDGEVKRARLYISGLGFYEASINGRPAGDRALDPAWTTYDKRVFYSTLDVTGLLQKGENVIAAMLGNGWYNPLPMRMWGRINLRRSLTVGRPRLIARLEMELLDGTKKAVVTDRTWKWTEGPILRNSIYLGEIYDARLEVPGWDRPGFNDRAWKQVSMAEEAVGPLQAQPLPPIRVKGKIKAAGITEPKPGIFLFDLGRNFAGWVRLRVKGEAGTFVKMRFGELLHEDGTLNVMTSVCGQIKREGVGGPGAPPLAYQSDTYILKGSAEEEVYTPRFTFHAFRYVEVTGFPGKPDLQAIEGLPLRSDVALAGTFSCSSEFMNRIQEMVSRTFQSNLFGVQSDCPHRERFGYGGDIVATDNAFILNFDMAAFYAKTVRDFADAARPGGGLTETAPYVGIADGGFGEGTGPIGWGIAHPLLLRDLYRYYGDRRIVEEQYGVAKRWVDLVRTRWPDHIVKKGLSDHESLEKKPVEVTGTAFNFQAVKLLCGLARVLGLMQDTGRYERLAAEIRKAFVERFMSDGTGRVGEGTQASQAAALFHGLVPPNLMDGALKKLVEAVESNGGRLATGIFGTPYMLAELARLGRGDLAYRMIARDDFPGWGFMMKNGATTLWEHWKFSDNTYSHNHPMFGSVSALFFRGFAGINPAVDAVGFDRIVIQPQVVGLLTWARGRYESMRGPVESSWRLEGGRFELFVQVPVGAKATVHVPTDEVNAVTESGRPAREAEGVRYMQSLGHAAVFEVESGRYIFSAPLKQAAGR